MPLNFQFLMLSLLRLLLVYNHRVFDCLLSIYQPFHIWIRINIERFGLTPDFHPLSRLPCFLLPARAMRHPLSPYSISIFSQANIWLFFFASFPCWSHLPIWNFYWNSVFWESKISALDFSPSMFFLHVIWPTFWVCLCTYKSDSQRLGPSAASLYSPTYCAALRFFAALAFIFPTFLSNYSAFPVYFWLSSTIFSFWFRSPPFWRSHRWQAEVPNFHRSRRLRNHWLCLGPGGILVNTILCWRRNSKSAFCSGAPHRISASFCSTLVYAGSALFAAAAPWYLSRFEKSRIRFWWYLNLRHF